MPALNPVEYLGIEAVRAGIPRWQAARAEGIRRAPKCDRILRDGRRCSHVSLPEARKLKPPIFRCHLHMLGDTWVKIDHLRRERGKRLARSENRHLRNAGLAMLRQVEIREVRRTWAINPEFEAKIIVLSPGDQSRVSEWLAAHGCDLGYLQETGRPMTACRRSFVHLRVALHLSGRLPERLALKSIRSAVHRDVKWYGRKAALEAELPAWGSSLDGVDQRDPDEHPLP